MADEMAQSNNFDPMAQYARLSERVENQGKDIIDLRSNMNTGFQTVTASINALSNEFRANTKTQWPVIWAAAGVCFTILAAAGTFFYATLSKGQDRLDTYISKVDDTTVDRQEMDWRAARGQEDRLRMEGNIADLRASIVPRMEYEAFKIDIQRQVDRMERRQTP
jgi:hypothetical protein